MAEILCPNCGKPNPDDQDTCEYCLADLKPLKSPSAFTSERFGEPSEQGDEIPDWLKDLRGFDEGGLEESLKSESTPEWLQEVSPPEKVEMKPGEEPAVPDWLAGIREQAELPEEMIEEPAPPAAETLPDWLNELKSPQSFPETIPPERVEQAFEETSAPAFQPSSDMPEWLANLTSQQPSPDENIPPGEPDWLIGTADQAGPPQPDSSTPAFNEGSLSGLKEEEVLPDWLQRLEAGSSDTLASGVPALILGDEGISQPPPSSQDLSGSEALSVEPEWLSQVSAESETPPEAPKVQEAEQEAGLAKATLPSWLEAMRPIETAEPVQPFVDGAIDERVEGTGPLAGLRGVLAAENEIAKVRKPVAYSIKLQVPTDQQGRLELLQNLVETENNVKPLPAPAAVSISSIMRVALFILLVLAVIWALSGSPIVSVPGAQSVPAEIATFHTTMDALPPNAQVLIAFDYEPGFSGELEASISAALNQLDQKNASLVIVSTTINGPYLAERMIQQLNGQTDREGKAPVRYFNLGYIPGGASGLRVFASTPSQLMQFDLKNGKSPWNGNPLDFQKEIKNFKLAIVITENPDTARSWVEQVGPTLRSGLNTVPLLMIVSGQAEPMVYPYYEGSSRQVAGILAGLRGGAIYEGLTGRSGKARQYWDAYSLAILTTVFLTLVGGLASAMLNALAQSRGKKKEEGKA